MRTKGYFRKVWRGMRSPARAVLTLVSLGLIAMFGVSMLSAVFFSSTKTLADNEVAHAWLPIGLMFMFLLQVISPGKKMPLVFSPAEIDFLFAGPFHRNDLVLYKILTFSSVIVFPAIFMSAYAAGLGAWWPAAFTGLCLFILAGYFTTIVLSLTLENIAARYRWWTKGAFIGILLIAVAFIVRFYALNDIAEDPVGAARRLIESQLYAVALAPFRVFSEIALAQSLNSHLLVNALIAVGMNFGGLLLILKLDAQFFESSLAQSQRMQKRMEKVKRGKLFSAPRARSAKLSIPVLPRWRGMGTILRQQLLGALRGYLAFQLIGLAIVIGVVAGYAMRDTVESSRGELVQWMPLGVIAYIMLFLMQIIRYDFRSDVDCLDRLKSLPVGAFPLALGEIAVPTMIATLAQVVLCLCFALANGSPPLNPALTFVLFSINGLVFSVENAFFLVFPTRKTLATTADLSDFGRNLLLLMLKVATLLLVLGLAVGAGALALFVSGSYPIGVFAGWLVLTACVAAFVLLVAEAFKRLDPSLDFG